MVKRATLREEVYAPASRALAKGDINGVRAAIDRLGEMVG